METVIQKPYRMSRLPIDKHGRVVPWFVANVNGQPDHRVIKPGALREAYSNQICWLCGDRLGRFKAFVLGPMCTVNRLSAEPPSHLSCAEYAVQVCPFLTTPRMVRRENNLPEDFSLPAGVMIRRNPGVAAIWTTLKFSLEFDPASQGLLFRLGDPSSVLWFCEGREATRAEVEESIESGLPILMEMAQSEGPESIVRLLKQKIAAMKYFPSILETNA